MTDAELVVYEGALLSPAADLATVASRFGEYHELCRLLLTDDDWQVANVPRPFLKRSGWRKLATAMGVNLEQLRREVHRDDGGAVVWAEFTYRATAPNGRFADAIGGCAFAERKPHAWAHRDHDITATAETRAKNRACADLFGLGALSAEEIDGEHPGHPADREAAPVANRPLPNGGRPPIDLSGPPWQGELNTFRAACSALAKDVGRDPDILRHQVVAFATDNRTKSSKELTAGDMPRVWEALRSAREQLL